MNALTPKVGVPPVFPNINRPVTLGRVGEFRRMVDRYNRVNQGALPIPGNTNYTRTMNQNFRMVKARVHSKIDLIA